MTEHKITIKDKEYTIASPSLDKTMRITDHISEVLEELPGIFDDIENYKIQYKLSHREILTKEDIENESNKEIIEALGVSLSDFDNEDELAVDEETGKIGIAFYKSPSDGDVIAAVFPKIWKAARKNIVELCALVITSDGELEEHDKRGAVNGLIENRSHWLRHNADLNEIVEILSVGVVIFREQVESASKALGKVTENLTGMLSEAQPEEAKLQEGAPEVSEPPAEEQN